MLQLTHGSTGGRGRCCAPAHRRGCRDYVEEGQVVRTGYVPPLDAHSTVVHANIFQQATRRSSAISRSCNLSLQCFANRYCSRIIAAHWIGLPRSPPLVWTEQLPQRTAQEVSIHPQYHLRLVQEYEPAHRAQSRLLPLAESLFRILMSDHRVAQV